MSTPSRELSPVVRIEPGHENRFSIPAGHASWSIQEDAFPATGSTSAKLLFLLRYAVLAPSTYNTQPWKFRVGDDHIDVIADRARALPQLDAHGRELVMSCGAALQNLRVAARYYGFADSVEPFPDAGRPDCVARLRLRGGAVPEVGDRDLFRAIALTRLHDGPLDAALPSKHLLRSLRHLAARLGCTLDIAEPPGRRAHVEDLIIDADRRQRRQPALMAERNAWTREPGSNAADGMPAQAPRCPRRTHDLGAPVWSIGVAQSSQIEPHERQLVDWVQAAPVLAVLITPGNGPSDWLAAGQAWQALCLAARHAGIWFSPLNQPVQVPALRRRLRRVMRARGWPQLVARLGFGPEVKPLPRRNPQVVMAPH